MTQPLSPDEIARLRRYHNRNEAETPTEADVCSCGGLWPCPTVRLLDMVAADEPNIDCPLCGENVKQVSSATLSLALWQHVHWVCKKACEPREYEGQEQ